jgi:predicted nucleic acid-binding Zn ribbon protein
MSDERPRDRPSDRPSDRHSDLRRLRDSLAAVTGHLGTAEPKVLGDIFGHWNDVVGEAIAAHARPRSLRGGVLTIGVDDPVWATQLRFLEQDLIDRCRDLSGPSSVRSLRIVVEAPR